MRNLRAMIEEEEKKHVVDKKHVNNNTSKDDPENLEPQQSTSEKIKEVKSTIKKSELKFPSIYLDEELLFETRKVYGGFISKLRADQRLTRDSLEEVIPEFLSNIHDLNKYDKEIIEEMEEYIIDHLIGYGPISTIFRLTGDGLNDVIVNTCNYIDIIYKGKTYETPFVFGSEEELRKIIDRMLAENNRKIDEAHPIISSKLKDGSRVEVQIPPIAANDGSCVTIRKFQDVPLLLEHLLDGGQMDYKMAYFLLKAAKGKANIIVSGGTSSGKTTFLNAVTRFVDSAEQLITIEDTKEMQPQMPCHSIRAYEGRMANEEGKGAIPLDFLLRSALRSSPRRIVVGECRGPEIVVMLNAMNTGHPGSMTTVHADNTKEAIVRIENMYLEARPSANINFIRAQIVSAVDIIVQLVRFPDGARKVIAISELERRIEDNSVVSLNDIFRFKRDSSDTKVTKGEFEVMSVPNRSIEKMEMFGVDIDSRIFDKNFEMPKQMLLEELEKDLPNKMCGWKDKFIEQFIENDNKILHKWPYLQQLLEG